MERRLIVMRHATAAPGSGLASDHVRPLTAHGTAEALDVAAQLVERGWQPTRALVSDAARTTETWWAMADLLGAPRSMLLSSLYGAGIEALIYEVKRLPNEVDTVLVLGHNPGWSQAASWLCGHTLSLSTANAVLLSADGSRWTDVLGAAGLTLRDVLRPE